MIDAFIQVYQSVLGDKFLVSILAIMLAPTILTLASEHSIDCLAKISGYSAYGSVHLRHAVDLKIVDPSPELCI